MNNVNETAKRITADTGVPVSMTIYLIELFDDEHLIRRALELVRKEFGHDRGENLRNKIMLTCKWMKHWDQRFGPYTGKYEFPSRIRDIRGE